MGKNSSKMFKLSRIMRDLEVITSGSPKKVASRAKNKYVGRKVIRKLWKWP
ncbi:MAG: hypothetical protein SWK76_05285 [Actinomycetota bacterium]|nr:hypothetical protein [Actinomycetota bacterium]